MEDSSNKAVVAVAMAMLLVVLSKQLLKYLLFPKTKLNLPPGPWTLPVIGSIHHLTGSPLTFRTLRGLARKHGQLMMLRLGEVPTVVASSAEAAEEILKTHDLCFADRYFNATLNALTYNGIDIGGAPYGERLRQLRKICALELLSAARVQSFQSIREEEAARFMEKLAASAAAGSSVDLSKELENFINDILMRECVGSRSKHQGEYLDAFHSALRQTAGLSLADLFPSSRVMQMLSTAPRKVLECRDRMQRILEQIMQEQKEAMDMDGGSDDKQTFVGVLLRLQKQGNMPIDLTNDTISSLMFDMFSGGGDTSSNTLNWCMAELVRSPATMAKLQVEVRRAFKGKTRITEDDLARAELSYFHLVIKETMRMHPQIPLLAPRQCRQTCRVMGYDIPKGTMVLVNVWAIGRDPKYWDDPEEFEPERFRNSNIDYKGTNFEYLPFGSGRRMCPGMNLGLGNLYLALVSLLYHFDWKLPDGVESKDVEMTEAAGMISNKRTHLIVHPVTHILPSNNA